MLSEVLDLHGLLLAVRGGCSQQRGLGVAGTDGAGLRHWLRDGFSQGAIEHSGPCGRVLHLLRCDGMQGWEPLAHLL